MRSLAQRLLTVAAAFTAVSLFYFLAKSLRQKKFSLHPAFASKKEPYPEKIPTQLRPITEQDIRFRVSNERIWTMIQKWLKEN